MRTVPRIPVTIGATRKNGAKTFQGKILNLGLKGAFVSLPKPLQEKPLVTLRFSPSKTQQPLEVLGRIVRRTSQGVGLAFLDLDPQHQQILWSSLLSQWPGEMPDCPFCGSPLPAARQKACSTCRLPLDFQNKRYLEMLPDDDRAPQEMIGTCPAIFEVFQLVRKLATTDVPVLITGATGTGKEMVALAIHQRSERVEGRFVAVNCGAIPGELLESELFGHEKGAFTGAHRSVMGKVELAHGGTLFLDEVGELPLALQVKLLRFLQDQTFERVGGRETKQVDVRILAATNSNLRELISAGRFRDDLYYRLNVVNVNLPDLKNRGEDPLIMATVFLRRYAAKTGKKITGFTPEAVKVIQTYPWPGNIRELINHIRRAVVMAEGPKVTPENLGLQEVPLPPADFSSDGLGLKEAKEQLEAKMVTEALARYRGNVQMAAKVLKTARSVIYYLINKYNLKDHVSPELRELPGGSGPLR
jgi:two-component system NtrC family response regulator